MNNTIPTLSQIKNCLVKHYKHDRLEGRDNWFKEEKYSDTITKNCLEEFLKFGFIAISRWESNNGKSKKLLLSDII